MGYFTLSIVFLVAGIFPYFGECLHCWECNSKYDPNCGEPFKNHTIALADCNQRFLKDDPAIPASLCRKITQKVRGDTRVVRSCGFYNPEDAGKCITRAGTHLVFMHYCQCEGEGCNTASSMQQQTFLLTVFSFLISIACVRKERGYLLSSIL